MIRVWLAPAGQLVLPWPLLAVLVFVLVLLFGMACYGKGRRDTFREIDERRARVLAACEEAAADRVRVPGQRRESS